MAKIKFLINCAIITVDAQEGDYMSASGSSKTLVKSVNHVEFFTKSELYEFRNIYYIYKLFAINNDNSSIDDYVNYLIQLTRLLTVNNISFTSESVAFLHDNKPKLLQVNRDKITVVSIL